MTSTTETKVLPPIETSGIGNVFCDECDNDMNVVALLNYLRALKQAGRKIDIVEYALAEAEDLFEGGNETVDLDNFAASVGQQLRWDMTNLTNESVIPAVINGNQMAKSSSPDIPS